MRVLRRTSTPRSFAWRRAVDAEDKLNYDEPADWCTYPTRESLGAALFKAKLTEQARAVFRDDLERIRTTGARCADSS